MMRRYPETWPCRKVPLSQIDWADRSFRLTYQRPVGALARSIQGIGLLHPPVVQPKDGDRWRIVCGFRRLMIFLKGGQSSLDCRIAPIETAEKDLLLLNFQENLDRGFNPVEQSWLIKKLSPFMGKGELVREILPLIGIAPRKELLEGLLSITEISPVYWPFLLEGRLFPEIVQALVQQGRPWSDQILALFILLRWSFQKQKEFLNDLQELSRRNGQPPKSILLSGPVLELLSDPKGTPQQKGEALRNYFRNSLYPVLSKTEKIFNEKRASLNLDQRTRLIPPPFFEGGTYALEIKFSDSKKLKASMERIDQALAMGQLDDLP